MLNTIGGIDHIGHEIIPDYSGDQLVSLLLFDLHIFKEFGFSDEFIQKLSTIQPGTVQRNRNETIINTIFDMISAKISFHNTERKSEIISLLEYSFFENLDDKKAYRHNIELIDGVLYDYVRGGNTDSDIKMVSLHGLVGSKMNFVSQLSDQQLLDKVDHIALNMYLHLYDPHFSEYNFNATNEYIKSFIDAKNFDSVVLHGVSLGGELSYNFAAQYPQYVRGLFLSGASGLQQESIELGNTNLISLLRNPEGIAGAISKQFHNSAKCPNSLIKEVTDFVTKKSSRPWTISFARKSQGGNVDINIELLSIIKNHNIFTATFWGKHDMITPFSIAEKFIHRLGVDPEYSFAYESGHTPNLEVDDEYNRDLSKAIEKILERR